MKSFSSSCDGVRVYLRPGEGAVGLQDHGDCLQDPTQPDDEGRAQVAGAVL